MGSRILNTKQFVPTPPDKGSFPLDHEGLCKKYMLRYMICLHENERDNSSCRDPAKEYLSCRMDNNLMSREEWSRLGFPEEMEKKETTIQEKNS